MTAQPLKKGSEDFTNTSLNRDSIEPVAVIPDGEILHQGVCKTGDENKFSKSRGHPVFPVSVPSKNISLSIGVLDPQTKTSNHRHAYESLIFILEGSGYTVIERKRYDWKAGDAIYVAPWNWHQHGAENEEARYITATNLPLLTRLGQTVLRQEEKSS